MTVKTTKKSAVKGTVAAAAGVAVLLGGMGTFAIWNASGNIGSADTTTGHLTADFTSAMTWTDTHNPETPVTIGDFKLVPGDELTGTQTIKVDASGDNLVVKPTITYADGELPDTVSVDYSLAGVPEGGELPNGETDLTATIDLKFDQSATGDMDEQIDLSRISVNLVQVAPSQS